VTIKQAPLVVYVVTSAISRRLLTGQLEYISAHGFRPLLIVGDNDWEGKWLSQTSSTKGNATDNHGETMIVPMTREISPVRDLISFFRLWQTFRRLKPAITNVSTPKAGLLGGLAAAAAGVPCRIYTARGLRFETAQGVRRKLLFCTEFLACWSAHRVVAVSDSLRRLLIDNQLAPNGKIVVLGKGSSNGVDADRFDPQSIPVDALIKLRASLGIPKSARVIGFVGRLTGDKGIVSLVEAYEILCQRIPNLCLLLVGDFEQGDTVDAEIRARIEADSRIVRCGFVSEPVVHYQLMDVVALPTYREGFPNVVLEAQAAGKAVVTTRVTGAVDSIEDGVTGVLVTAGDSVALASALERLLDDTRLREQMGRAGRERVKRDFRRKVVWDALLNEYRALAQSKIVENADPSSVGSRHKVQPRELEPSSAAWGVMSHSFYARHGKRALDLVLAAVALVLTAPIMALIAVAIRLTMGHPVLFKQDRPGLKEEIFTLFKFRTMSEAHDSTGKLLTDSARLTRLGALLRATSLDELPEFWNVLRGDMSLVGPRPLLVEYLPYYSSEERKRHAVRPGLTGLAQVNGRNATTWAERLDNDVTYSDTYSLSLDLLLLLCTIRTVLGGDGGTEAIAKLGRFRGCDRDPLP
jgi:lipopolysaccharide/colanic/teichoic acid biosynthesis glycosyltransferase/glycosyltransferase involved in cell wall biosynthesis